MNWLLTLFLYGFSVTLPLSPLNREVSKNDMKVEWRYRGDRLLISMSAPTQGWVTVGFNEREGLQGAYLLMGRVTKKGAEVVEHSTLYPGNYQSFESLGLASTVADVYGAQSKTSSMLRFSIPITREGKCGKNLSPGKTIHMVLAYSQSDDFQHHSLRRCSEKIIL